MREDTRKVSVDHCTTGLRDPHGVLIRKPLDTTANHRSILTPFENKRCTGHHQHASARNRALAKTAQCTPKMQSLFAEAVQNAHDMVAVSRDPCLDHPHASSVLVASTRGFDYDDPSILRHPGGCICDHHQEDGDVLHVLITPACTPHHIIETQTLWV
eukprot:6062885-Pyramimonas_sp.AAC.1